jgi:D-lactate dehydrogenase (cytochrome)
MGAIELLDEVMVKACNEYSGMSLVEKPCILFKFTGSKAHCEYDIQRVKEITSKHTKHEYMWAKSEEERDKLWGMRKHAFWAVQHAAEKKYGPEMRLMSTDVAVPISQLAKAIEDTKKELEKSFLYAPIVGHVGDGNYHVCIAFDPADPKQGNCIYITSVLLCIY